MRFRGFGHATPRKRLGGQDDVFLHSGAGDHLGADTLADTVVFSTNHSNDREH